MQGKSILAQFGKTIHNHFVGNEADMKKIVSALQEAISLVEKADNEANEKDIISIIDWWELLPPDFVDLQTLMHKRRLLNVMYYKLANYRRDLIKRSKAKYIERSIEEKKSSIAWQNKTNSKLEFYSATAAKERALIDIEPLYKEQYSLEAEVDGLGYLANAAKEVLESMRQEIAHLRGTEKDNENTQAHSQS